MVVTVVLNSFKVMTNKISQENRTKKMDLLLWNNIPGILLRYSVSNRWLSGLMFSLKT